MGSRRALHSPAYRMFCGLLRRWRAEAGLTERALAERLGRDHTWVHRNETGDRRVDPVELLALCRALEIEPARAMAELEEAVGATTKRSGRKR